MCIGLSMRPWISFYNELRFLGWWKNWGSSNKTSSPLSQFVCWLVGCNSCCKILGLTTCQDVRFSQEWIHRFGLRRMVPNHVDAIGICRLHECASPPSYLLKTCAIKAQRYVCLGRGTSWSAQFIRESYGHALAISSHGIGVVLADSVDAASSTMTRWQYHYLKQHRLIWSSILRTPHPNSWQSIEWHHIVIILFTVGKEA